MAAVKDEADEDVLKGEREALMGDGHAIKGDGEASKGDGQALMSSLYCISLIIMG